MDLYLEARQIPHEGDESSLTQMEPGRNLLSPHFSDKQKQTQLSN